MSKKEKQFIHIPKNESEGPSWIAIVATAVFQIYPVSAFLLFLKLHRMWQNRKLEKYRMYVRAIGNSLAISIKKLAKTVGDSKADVRDNLSKMIAKGYLGPEAYIDRAKDMLYILRPSAEEQHENAGSHINIDLSDLGANLSEIFSGITGIAGDVARTLKDEFRGTKWDASAAHNYAPSGTKPGSEKQPEPEVQPETTAEEPVQTADDDSGKSESEATLAKLTQLNDDIADEEVSRKIDRIAMLTGDIYAFVALNPERSGEVRKFMNYYLPTTMKLLTSYSLLERQSYQGENIINARKDIEKILDTLVHAFEKQLDQLFATDAVDISSDIQVLETMIAKDGLSEGKQGYQLRL